MKGIALFLAVSGVMLPHVAQACRSDAFSTHWGDSLDVNMLVRSGETCRFGFQPGRGSHVDRAVISVLPQHGTVTQNGLTHFMYHAANGYAGPDVLRLTATGNSMGGKYVRSGDTNYTYDIRVVP